MSLKKKEDDLKQAEELLAVKDRRIKELERLLLKAQMLLHNAGVCDVLTSSPDETEDYRAEKEDNQKGITPLSEDKSGQLTLDGNSNGRQSQNCEKRTENSPASSQGAPDKFNTVVKSVSSMPVDLDIGDSAQSPVVTHTPFSKLSDRNPFSAVVSSSGSTASAVIVVSNTSTVTTIAKSGELMCANNRKEYISLSTCPSRIMVVPGTTRECCTIRPVSSVATNCSLDSSVLLCSQANSSQFTQGVINSIPGNLNCLSAETSRSSSSPLSTSNNTVPTCTTTSGSLTSASYTSIVTVSSPITTSCSPFSALKDTIGNVTSCATTSGSIKSTSYSNIVNKSSQGTLSCSPVSTSSGKVITETLLTTTSGSLILATSDNIDTVHLSATQSTDSSTHETSLEEGRPASFSISFAKSQVNLDDSYSVLSSTSPVVTSVEDETTPATKIEEPTRRELGDPNMKGQLGDVAIYFADDFENFDIAQEETVSMESDIAKQDDVDHDEETFVPPSDFPSTSGKSSKNHRKYFSDLFDFVCQEQNHQPLKKLEKNICGECGKTFASKRILRQHVKIIHESEKTYLCNVCQKVFRHLHNLNIHKQNQNHFIEGEEHLVKERKLFKCPVCNKTFRHKSNLQDHVRLHSGDRPFGCSYCDRRFAQISNCRKHERTHTGKRPFSCDLCPKTFTSSSNLNRHQVTHNLQKNYLCPICGKAFTQKWNLTKHEKKHKICHKSKSTETILLSKSETNKVISSPAIEVKVVHIL